MAQKFEILKDDFLKITDTVTSQIKLLEPKSNVFYNVSNLNVGQIKMYSVKGVNKFADVIFETTIGEAIDGSDVVFTAQTFEDFCTDSKLGFKAASGGSGAGGDSYIQMYNQTRQRLPSNGNFVGINEAKGYTNNDMFDDTGESVAVNYVENSQAIIIGYSDFAYKLEKIRAAGNVMNGAQQIQLVVGYRDIRGFDVYFADSPNPVVLHTENIDYSDNLSSRTWTKLVTFATPLDVPADKEIVIGYKVTIFNGGPSASDLWHTGTTLTLKKV
jgi:hypothetical protein